MSKSTKKKLANNIWDGIWWSILNINGREIIDKLAVLSSVTTNANAHKIWMTI